MGVGKEKEEKNTCTPIQYQGVNAPVSPQTTQADGVNKMCSQSRSLITGRSCGVEGNGGLEGKFEVVRERIYVGGLLGLLEICLLKCSLSLDRCYLLVFKDKLFSLTCPGDSCSRDRWP